MLAEMSDSEFFDKALIGGKLLAKLRAIGYFEAPASKGHHLAVPGGLFAHSKNVAKLMAKLLHACSNEASSYRVGLLHDLVKCYCYKQVGNDRYEYVQPPYPGHGVASVMIAHELGFDLTPEETAAIAWHIGAFGLDDRRLKEYDAACRRFPREVILTHAADHLASKLESELEGGVK